MPGEPSVSYEGLSLVVLTAIGAAFLLIAALTLATVVLAWHVLSARGSFGGLVRHYAVDRLPDGDVFGVETVQVGSVRWRRCVQVSVSPAGLGLAVGRPFLAPRAVLIPWARVTSVESTRLYWGSAQRLTIGAPAITHITMRSSLYRPMQHYVEAAHAD